MAATSTPRRKSITMKLIGRFTNAIPLGTTSGNHDPGKLEVRGHIKQQLAALDPLLIG
jgi:hypothetical protein